MSVCVVETPIGQIRLTAENGYLTEVRLADEPPVLSPDAVLQTASAELKAYFSGEQRIFSVPLSLRGTPFQRAVWAVLQTIPYGQTISYGEVARRAGYPTALRAVGTAVGRNPLLIFVPCHRVIRGDGALGGFAEGPLVKQRLLQREEVKL